MFKLKKRRISYVRIIGVALLLMVLIWGCDSLRRVTVKQNSDEALQKCIKKGKGEQVQISDESQSSDEQDSYKAAEESYDSVVKNKADLSVGSLTLVNRDHEFVFPENEDGLVKMADNTNRDHYKLAYLTYLLDPEALSALNNMMKDFHSVHESNDVTVYEAYKSHSAQNDSYSAPAEGTEILSGDNNLPAGFSEHHTGYAVDFILVDSASNIRKFDGTGDYEWFKKNCFKYGFILRYPEHKEESTHMAYQPAHFRYVGIPHSYIMNENDYSLEEYISELKKYQVSGEHLTYSLYSYDYEIYYVKSTGDSTSVPVLSDTDKKVVVSGNNEDGFIVTVTSKKETEEQVTTSAVTNAAVTESTSATAN